MEFLKTYRGIIGTVIFHIGIIVMLLYLHYSAPFPPPPEEGILINFGTNELGSGLQEPQKQTYTPPVKTITPKVTPPPKESAPPVQVTEQKKKPAEKLMTQNNEEAPAVKTQTNKVDEAEKKRLAEIEKKHQAELERQRQAELERQRLEAEKKKQAELERQRLEKERLRKEKEQQQRNAINERMKKSFGGQADNGNNSGQGDKVKNGNKGVNTGAVESRKQANTLSRGSGISFSLEGRNVIGTLAKPEYKVNDYGTVVVEITVNKEGKVVAAVPGKKGSTTNDSRLLEAARKAALQARFNKVTSTNAAIYQKGTITYHFRLL
ncbi:MAG: TonB family protein [Bacteroidales bacterium]|nr:TonB family protein [Bacteroidales bacterium]